MKIDKPPLLVLIGPTAVGKTKLSIAIAKALGCEIISGDSMQVYRKMDIGTAKIKQEEMEGVPHYLIDVVNPDEPFTAADFQEWAGKLVEEIGGRGRIPFIVGGTGLYIESFCYGFRFSPGGADEDFRAEQQRFMEEHGNEALHERLREQDPITAERLHPNDYRRVIRALEIAHVTGIPLSKHLESQTKESPYRLCIIGLTMERSMLYKRVEERIDGMIEDGLVDEVAGLLAEGFSPDLISMQGLGYKEIISFLHGHLNLEEAVHLLKRNTRHFAKRQLSWFRHMSDIAWVDVGETLNFSAQIHIISDIIAGKFAANKEYNSEQL